LATKTEDFPSSSINIFVSNASININSVTGSSNGNPDSDGLSLPKEIGVEPDEPPVRKERLTAWQIPEPLGSF
jgi:Uma2 family endonuclease